MYNIGSDNWNGLGKVLEETSELNVVLSKLIGSTGDVNHWSGNLLKMMLDELADVEAAIEFFKIQNFNSEQLDYIKNRKNTKIEIFKVWNNE